MVRRGYSTALVCAALILSCRKQGPTGPARLAPTEGDLLAEVDPLIGTQGEGSNLYGGTIPGVGRPFGMTQWTAATRANKIGDSPYRYDDPMIGGFLGTHQPAIWMGDYGYVSLMPGVGSVDVKTQYRFRHDKEAAKPSYYRVTLEALAGPILAEITATERAGLLRFTVPDSADAYVALEAIRSQLTSGSVEVRAAEREIVGRNPDRHSASLGPPLKNFAGYFVAQFSRPFATFGTWDDLGKRPGATRLDGPHVGAFVTFARTGGTTVLVKVGTSFISIDQARDNLAQEIPDWDFDRLREEGAKAWNRALHRIEVEGGSPSERKIFYTALYHALLYPRIFSEYGLYYSAFDDQVHPGVSYNDFSLWDTFRAEHPLILLVFPERAGDMVRSLIQMYDEGGRLPIWPNPTETNIMLGTHADCVVADAFLKGVRGYDVKKAYQAVRKDAFEPPIGDSLQRWGDRTPWTGTAAPPNGTGFEARGGLTWYQQLGFVPADKTEESVSRTIEFGIDDYCVAQMAKQVAPADEVVLRRRLRGYRDLFNATLGQLAPKDSHGGWFRDPTVGFTEGDPWTYLFGALHDVPGMIEMLGGPEKFVAKLDENFVGKHHRHDNEPGHHYAYLYDYAGAPWKTQATVRDLLATQYSERPSGLSGNDDCGQMSAWYIFSALGFYPVTPASGEYAIGSPLFTGATLQLGDNAERKLSIEVVNQAPANAYLQSVELNGTPLKTPFLRHADLAHGDSRLRFVLGPQPNREWGQSPSTVTGAPPGGEPARESSHHRRHRTRSRHR